MLATDRPDSVARRCARRGQYRQGAEPAGGARSDPRAAPTLRCPTKNASRHCNSHSLRPATTRAAWLAGWYPEVLAAAADRRRPHLAARRTLPPEQAPILYVQPDCDPLAHAADAHAYKAQFGDRVTVVAIARASHAVIVEQPEAVSAALIAYARQLWAAE